MQTAGAVAVLRENSPAILPVEEEREKINMSKITITEKQEAIIRRLNDPLYTCLLYTSGRWNHKQIEKIAKEQPGREFWERKYPGWTLTDNVYGVTYEYNDFTGWSIYLKLRKKE